ncbi:hypothetical protein [Paenibacillus sp. KS-LC4]|uniref:hypothetical protein n=1 Tax=Paenibacillus sp. KS-LC4 TaxID=2979727 RepID=UPI0030CFDDE0
MSKSTIGEKNRYIFPIRNTFAMFAGLLLRQNQIYQARTTERKSRSSTKEEPK